MYYTWLPLETSPFRIKSNMLAHTPVVIPKNSSNWRCRFVADRSLAPVMLCTTKKKKNQHNKKDPRFCQSMSSWWDGGKIMCVCACTCMWQRSKLGSDRWISFPSMRRSRVYGLKTVRRYRMFWLSCLILYLDFLMNQLREIQSRKKVLQSKFTTTWKIVPGEK